MNNPQRGDQIPTAVGVEPPRALLVLKQTYERRVAARVVPLFVVKQQTISKIR